jgi:CheY-like chemotaxis protein
VASTVAEALDLANREEPDVLIADIGMPYEDGFALIRKLRTGEREHPRKHLPAIALTAYASSTDRDEALTAGYDLHLTKPVGPADLVFAVAKFAKTREQEM